MGENVLHPVLQMFKRPLTQILQPVSPAVIDQALHIYLELQRL